MTVNEVGIHAVRRHAEAVQYRRAGEEPLDGSWEDGQRWIRTRRSAKLTGSLNEWAHRLSHLRSWRLSRRWVFVSPCIASWRVSAWHADFLHPRSWWWSFGPGAKEWQPAVSLAAAHDCKFLRKPTFTLCLYDIPCCHAKVVSARCTSLVTALFHAVESQAPAVGIVKVSK